MIDTDAYENMTWETPSDELEDAVENLLAEVKRLQSEPTVTVDDYHKKGHLYVTVHFPDGEQYVGLVEKWEGEEE
jgi:ATP/maltotriose-dependent transcriptional regulator MalT